MRWGSFHYLFIKVIECWHLCSLSDISLEPNQEERRKKGDQKNTEQPRLWSLWKGGLEIAVLVCVCTHLDAFSLLKGHISMEVMSWAPLLKWEGEAATDSMYHGSRHWFLKSQTTQSQILPAGLVPCPDSAFTGRNSTLHSMSCPCATLHFRIVSP